uniref:NADH dehydrogenase subunit 5 n=1 Tax=Sinocentrus brevicornis TaxID=3038129 RepID=UPI002551FA3B|nr:NADH dehydrogenase subunit 5 [Sinocentrus brevicornis]WFD60960.1 NADH dehydrogenase subunit 5 [Sinocentrus brevicornis]
MFNKYFIWFSFFLFLSVFMFYFGVLFILNDMCVFLEYKMFFLNSLNFYYVMILDSSSMLFISIVLFISSMVILYSSFYMGYNSISSIRFLYLVLLFVFSMLLMILSPNMISILLGWDGLGLVSYCLVIYYSSITSNLSGMITCLTNRIGDIGILICIGWISSYGSWNFVFYNFYFDKTIFFMLVLSFFTKSAQVPFSCWLPAAMAAPTPISALVHSSTLVTAGVYTLIRFMGDLVYFNFIFVLMGFFTMVFSSFCANYEFDLKKIIAFSTLSQLGLMILSIFLGFQNYSFFHLLTHAMFKSLLFLCSGIMIFYYFDNQDIRFMGGYFKFLPLTSCCFNVSNLALCGIPFLSGFYSKDLIIENLIFFGSNLIVILIFFFSLGLTCCYSFRLVYYSMIKSVNFMPLNCFKFEFNFMGIVVMIMMLMSVMFGCILNWFFNFDLLWIFFPFDLKIMTLISIMMGFYTGMELNNLNYLFNLSYYIFSSNMWFMFSYSTYLLNVFYYYFNNYYKVLYWGEFFLTLNMYLYMIKISSLFQLYLNNNFKIFLISYLMWFFLLL